MAANELAPWINSAGENGYRNSMAEFQGDGKTIDFEFNFAGGYLRQSDVKAYLYDNTSGLTTDVSASLVWVGPNTVQYSPAIPDTQYIVIYRDSQKTGPLVDFTTNARMTEANLDLVAKQAIFVAAEMVDRFDAINSSSSDAIERSFTALTTAQAAQAQATSAVATSNAAQTAAANALTNANSAVSVANNAQSVANGIDGKAQTALDNSVTAVNTANAAASTANGIDAKATSALSNSTSAVSTATAASTTAQSANSTAGQANTTAQAAQSAVSNLNTDVSAHRVYKDSDTGGAFIPSGPSASRPVPASGQHPIRYSETLKQFEGYGESAWGTIGGGATGGGTNRAFYLNDQIINQDFTIPAGQNAGSFGEITIDNAEVTVVDGEWSVV